MSLKLTSFTALIVSSILLVARCEVYPDTPGPNATFAEGGQCTTTWIGDTNSTTTWKNMAIELMTGSNTGMVHLTTVATGQDGTTDGSYTFTCPDVTPYSAIYFYQFTSPNIIASETQWTTRFAITSSSGETADPTNADQPDGEAIPWGTGALVDASSAVAAPDFSSSAVSSGAAVSTTSSSSSSSAAISTTTKITTTKATSTVGATSTGSAADAASSGSVASVDNAAIRMVILGNHMAKAMGIVVGGAAVFALFL